MVKFTLFTGSTLDLLQSHLRLIGFKWHISLMLAFCIGVNFNPNDQDSSEGQSLMLRTSLLI